MIAYELMEHQKQAIFRSSFQRDLFLAWEVGTGKSCGTINILRQRYAEAGRIMRTVIICPLIMTKKWKAEFGLFSRVDPAQIHILEGSIAKRIQTIKNMKDYAGIFITNYDAFQNKDLADAFMGWQPEILVCDESHVLKNYKSKRAKEVARIADICKHRYLLTGTPILNNAMDLYMQFRILDGYLGKGATFGTNFFVFRGQYFRDANASWAGKPSYFPKWEPRESAYQELMDKIGAKTLRVRKSDCLDLPPFVVEELPVELSTEQRRMYEQMKKEFVTWIDKEKESGTPKAVVARLAITKALRLQQIVSGFVKTDSGEEIRIKDCPRLEALRDLLEMICVENKVIVWACFKENYKMIAEVCKSLDLKYVEAHGDVANKDKFEAVRQFNSDPSIKVFIGNQGAMGVGIDLIPATYSVYYSRGFKLGDDLQSEARNYRRGSEIHDKVTRINLVAPDSTDQLIADALSMKIDISEAILDFSSKLKEER